jgi:hypothetical protein
VRSQFSVRWLACSHLLFYVFVLIVNLGYAPYNLCIFFLRQLTTQKIWQPLMIISSKFFSFNMWEWFLRSSVLEWIESDLLKINWLRGVILLIPTVLVPWGKFPLCHTAIRSISAFQDQISILIVGCVITRFASPRKESN